MVYTLSNIPLPILLTQNWINKSKTINFGLYNYKVLKYSLNWLQSNQDLILKDSLRASSDKMDSPFSLKLMSHFIRHGQLTHPYIRSMAE